MSKHDITIVFEDGRTVHVPAGEDDTIYLACLMNKVRIQTDCLEGACATCKALCTSGEYRLDDHSTDALPEEEAARGYVLTCQMHALSDCVIEYAYDSSLALKTQPESRPGRIAAVEPASSTVYRLVVEAGGDDGPISFLPGQYVHLSIPGTEEQRSYSFANPPPGAAADGTAANGGCEFFIKVLEHGVMSEYVAGRAKAGDEVAITGPFGRFYLRPPTRPILMVAGGTGLAPMLSMLDHLAAGGGCDQPIHMLCGANTDDELFCLDRLAGYGARGLDLTTEFAVVEGGDGWEGNVGHVTGLLRFDIADGHDIYLCGPPPMIDAAETWLNDRGIDPALIHNEKFLPS